MCVVQFQTLNIKNIGQGKYIQTMPMMNSRLGSLKHRVVSNPTLNHEVD